MPNIINRISKPSPSIHKVISRSFILSMFFVLITVVIAALFFNQRNIQLIRQNNLQKEHEILGHLLEPAVSIEDSGEVLRLLSLSSDNNEFFAVINNTGEILLPDYKNMHLVQTLFHRNNLIDDCKNLQTTYRNLDGQYYWINCTPLTSNDPALNNSNLGILISYSKNVLLPTFSLVFYFSIMALTTLILALFWFRRILYQQLLKPLLILENLIVDKAKTPLTETTHLENIDNAPKEVLAIKHAFENVLSKLQSEYQQRTKTAKKTAILDIATRVAHDIRSPLVVMEITLHALVKDTQKEKVKMLKLAIQQVRDIANNLLEHYQGYINSMSGETYNILPDNKNLARPSLLQTIIGQVISQKRYEWTDKAYELDFTVSDETVAKWVCLSPNDLCRVLSNLLNNSYEAINENGIISVSLFIEENEVKLSIIDDGVGIPQDKIDAVLNGMSLKHPGEGFGLSSARNLMLSLQGNLELESKENIGTEIKLSFPCCEKPVWMPLNITLIQGGTVMVLDDDNSMQILWQYRLQAYNVTIKIFSSYEEAINWYNNLLLFENITFIVDYELSEQHNGLNFFNHIESSEYAYLITSHADEIMMQEAAEKADVWLIPKILANTIILNEINPI